MQGPTTTPTEDDEASIPTEHERNGPSMNPTITVRRKAAKRTLPWKLAADEIQLALSPPQDEDTRATKRPRLEEPASTDEAATDTTSHAITVALPPSDTTADHSDSDFVTETQPNARTMGATSHWTLVEDANLISAVTSTRKKKNGGKDWVAIAALVLSRTKIQCKNRWHSALNPSIDRVPGRTGTWINDEDIKLKAVVQAHGGKDWAAITALVTGRSKIQRQNRWHNAFNHSIDRTKGRTGKWTEDEDLKLQGAVRMHCGKDWVAIAALVPDRTRGLCWYRWKKNMDPNGSLFGGTNTTLSITHLPRAGFLTALDARRV
jgi:hypothetical protein